MPAKSTRRIPSGKRKKPHPDFPLFKHARGYWGKKVRQRLVYIGKVVDDADGTAVLEKWLEQKDDLLAGRTPRTPSDGCTIRDLANRFLSAKRQQVDIGELTARSFADYLHTCGLLVDAFGKIRLVVDLALEDFEHLRSALAKTRGPVALGNEIQRLRVVFKYGFDAGLIDRPVRYGPTFKRPSRKVLLKERARRGSRMFEARHIRRLLKAASAQMKAMILLGINCGFGNADVATLPRSALDLRGGWIRYPRPKTGIDRRCPLWPETNEALKVAITERPKPKDPALEERVVVTKYGGSWYKDAADNPIAKEFRKVLDRLDLYKRGLGFYALRHTFETIGGDKMDQVAVDHIMATDEGRFSYS